MTKLTNRGPSPEMQKLRMKERNMRRRKALAKIEAQIKRMDAAPLKQAAPDLLRSIPPMGRPTR